MEKLSFSFTLALSYQLKAVLNVFLTDRYAYLYNEAGFPLCFMHI